MANNYQYDDSSDLDLGLGDIEIIDNTEQNRILLSGQHIALSSETSTQRNIMILGTTQTGKSTFVEVLKNPTYECPNPTFFSKTRVVEPSHISFFYRDVRYNLKVLDTPGFLERYPTHLSNMTRSDEMIKRLIESCMTSMTTDLNIIMFCFNGNMPITQDQNEVLVDVIRELSPLSSIFSILVTHTEDWNEDQIISYKQSLTQDDLFLSLDLTEVNFLFTGCFKPSDLSDKEESAILREYARIQTHRTNILRYIFRRTESLSLGELDLTRSRYEACRINLYLAYKLIKSDFSTSREDFQSDLEKLLEVAEQDYKLVNTEYREGIDLAKDICQNPNIQIQGNNFRVIEDYVELWKKHVNLWYKKNHPDFKKN